VSQEYKWVGYIKDDKYVFRFTFRQSEGWRIYLLSYPFSTHNRCVSGDFHMLLDEFDRPYVCWDGYIDTYQDALSVARRWAQLYERYVYCGTPFDG
jgi:hypothetical protein